MSEGGETVGLISTSDARTAGGKVATAKIQKLKADALYLLNLNGAGHILLIFTEDSMLKHFEKEKKSGRFRPQISFLLAPLPKDIHSWVLAARHIASAETYPQGGA